MKPATPTPLGGLARLTARGRWAMRTPHQGHEKPTADQGVVLPERPPSRPPRLPGMWSPSDDAAEPRPRWADPPAAAAHLAARASDPPETRHPTHHGLHIVLSRADGDGARATRDVIRREGV